MPQDQVDLYADETAKFEAFIETHRSAFQKIIAQEGIFSLPVEGEVFQRDEGPIIGFDPEEARVYYYDVAHGVRQNTLGSRNTFNSKPWKVLSLFGLEKVCANMQLSAERAASDLLS